MGYLFEDFVEFSDMKKTDYIDELKKEAKKLPLSSIVENLNLNEIGKEVAREKNYKFEKGTPFSFSIRPIYIHFDLLVYPDKTKLQRDGSEIREYGGKSAVDFYNTLFKEIEEAIKEDQNDMPF